MPAQAGKEPVAAGELLNGHAVEPLDSSQDRVDVACDPWRRGVEIALRPEVITCWTKAFQNTAASRGLDAQRQPRRGGGDTPCWASIVASDDGSAMVRHQGPRTWVMGARSSNPVPAAPLPAPHRTTQPWPAK
jgi:hypothetical protein